MRSISTTFLVLGFILAAGAHFVQAEVNVSLDPANWDTYSPAGGAPTVSASSEGLTLSGAGYRLSSQMMSQTGMDFSSGAIFIQWKVHGPAGKYAAWGVGVGWHEPGSSPNVSDIYPGAAAGWTTPRYGDGFSTNNSWSGSKVMADDTWYYTRITVDENASVTAATATGGYDNAGGTLFYTHTYTLPAERYAMLAQAYVFATFNDNYGSTDSRLTLGEVRVDTEQSPGQADPLSVSPSSFSLEPGESATAVISGGTSPYSAVEADAQVALVSMSGTQLTVLAVGAGTTSITIMDSSDQLILVSVTVTARAEPPDMGNCAVLDPISWELDMPCVAVGDQTLAARAFLEFNTSPLAFQVMEYQFGGPEADEFCGAYDRSLPGLSFPCFRFGDNVYDVDLAFGPGFLPIRLVYANAALTTGNDGFSLTQLASQAISPASLPARVEAEGQAAVILPSGALSETDRLFISQVTNPPAPPFSNAATGGCFDIRMENRPDFNTEITLEFAFDPSSLPSDMPPEAAILTAYWDVDNGWVPVSKTVDADLGVIRVQTAHLSVWAWFTSFFQSGTVSSSGNFYIYFDPGQGPTIGGTQITMSQLAQNVGGYLEHALEKYLAAGFKRPDTPLSVILHDGAKDISDYGPLAEAIYLVVKNRDSADSIKHDSAHELFHSVQNESMTWYTMWKNLWFIESAAEAAADRVAWEGGVSDIEQLDERALLMPITQDKDLHGYETGRFMDYLVSQRNMSVKDLWTGVTTSGKTYVTALENLVAGGTQSSMAQVWDDYLVYIYFTGYTAFESTVQGKFSAKALCSMIKKITDAQPSHQHTFTLAGNYTGTLFAVTAEMPAGKTQREVEADIVGNPGGITTVHAYVVRTPNTYTAGGAEFIDDLGDGPVTVSLDSDDVLCLLGVNAGHSTQQFTVTVKDAFQVDLGGSQTVTASGSLTLSPQVTGGTPPYTYAWTLDQTPAGAGATLVVNGSQVAKDVKVTLTVTDANGQTATDTITLSPGAECTVFSLTSSWKLYTRSVGDTEWNETGNTIYLKTDGTVKVCHWNGACDEGTWNASGDQIDFTADEYTYTGTLSSDCKTLEGTRTVPLYDGSISTMEWRGVRKYAY